MLTQKTLKQRLSYDKNTGIFTWISSPRRGWAGKKAGHRWNDKSSNTGYVLITIDGVKYRAHHLAILYVTGSFPEAEVDHKDCDGYNNAFSNLRLSTDSQNAMNKPAYKNNKSGVKGVCLFKESGKFMGYVYVEKKRHYLGLFATLEDAESAVRAKRIELHGAFANHG